MTRPVRCLSNLSIEFYKRKELDEGCQGIQKIRVDLGIEPRTSHIFETNTQSANHTTRPINLRCFNPFHLFWYIIIKLRHRK